MKEKGIKHLPVVKGGKLKGIISDRDIKEYSPSKATSLDIYELHYLLAKTRIKELMRTKVITTAPRHAGGRGRHGHAGPEHRLPAGLDNGNSSASSRTRTSFTPWWTSPACATAATASA